MLSPACRIFRDGFLPGEDRPHRSVCASCDAWAERLEAHLRPPSEPRSVPSSLEDRLRRIGREESCRWIEEVWHDYLTGQLPPTDARRLDRHRERCPRCRELLRSLSAFLDAEPAPLPTRLETRLANLASPQRRRLPIWIRQARYAAAASYLLAVLASFAFGNPVVAAREALAPWHQEATARLQESTSLWERSWQLTLARYEGLARRGEGWFDTTRSWLEEHVTSRAGTDDDNPTSESREEKSTP